MSPRWSEWSPWTWDGTQARFWRARQDTQGNVEYDFEAPRGSGNVDDLANSFNNASLGGHEDPTYTQGDAYTHGTPIAADGSATAGPYGTSYAQPQSAYPAKGKGKSRAHPKEGHRDKGPSKKNRHRPAKNFADDDNPEDPATDELSPFYKRKGGAPSEPVPGSGAAYTTQQGHAEPSYGTSSQNAAYAPGLLQTAGADSPYGQTQTAGVDPRYGHAQTAGVDPRYGQPQTAADSRYGQTHTAGADPRYGQAQTAGVDPRYGQEPSTYSPTEPESTSPGQYNRHDYGSDSRNRRPESFAEDESTYPEQHGQHGYGLGRGSLIPESAVADDPPPEEDASDYQSTAADALPPDVQDALFQADPYMTGSVDERYSGGETSSMASAHTYLPSTDETDGRETPRPHAQQLMAAAAPSYYQHPGSVAGSASTGGETDMNSVAYAVEPSSKFRPGEVFKIMWCEPRGGGQPNKSEILTQRERVNHGSGSFYQGLRRFIVVANDEGHCTCVPILTYERQGCNKRGVKPLKHGIVHQANKRARMLPGEPQLGFEPVRVHLNERAEQLVKESRVNYAKLTTIEHNFPVFFIGRVDQDDFRDIVRQAVDTCWQRKRHHNY